ncbi:4Fe-4S binding protein [Phocaeicola sp.]
MEITNINLVYFSATYTTRKIVREIAGQISNHITQYDITTQSPANDIISHNPGELLIVGVPVYAGRVPTVALAALNKFKGNHTPAIIVCVYGNRDYDDAILELKDIVENNGFKVISAGAFIAQHSIFPKVAANRPDEDDMKIIRNFAQQNIEFISKLKDTEALSEIKVKGNNPYKIPGNIPLHPIGDKQCNKCGTCVKLCPVHAIPEDTPRKTDKKKCISCGRCIVICPQKARHFGGLIYKLAGWKFVKANSLRKEPELFETV